MAIILAVQKWRHYLLGRRFVIWMDQRSLKFIIEQREVGADYQRWMSKLMGYEFEIKYRLGITNSVVDALSRRMHELRELSRIESRAMVDSELVQKVIRSDLSLRKLKEDIEAGMVTHPGYTVINGLMLYKDRLVIPPTSSLIPKLLHEFHTSDVGGHQGDIKTYLKIAANWFWVVMRKQIARYVRDCDVCQRQKGSHQHPAGLLQPLPIPSQVWEEISMDFVEGLPNSGGVDTILVVVDRLTKYIHFVALKHPFTATSVAAVFVREIVRLHGFPLLIVTDRDRIFLSLFWKELFRLQGTTLLCIPPINLKPMGRRRR